MLWSDRAAVAQYCCAQTCRGVRRRSGLYMVEEGVGRWVVKWWRRGHLVEHGIVARRLLEAGIQDDFATITHVVILDSVTLVDGVDIYHVIGGGAVTPVAGRGSLSRGTSLAIRVLVELRHCVKESAEPVNPCTGEDAEDTTLMIIEV